MLHHFNGAPMPTKELSFVYEEGFLMALTIYFFRETTNEVVYPFTVVRMSIVKSSFMLFFVRMFLFLEEGSEWWVS